MKDKKMADVIKELAKKAAEYWVKLPEKKQHYYEEEGTSIIFEKVDDEAYSYILDYDDDDGSLFWALDEAMWDFVDELENK